MTIEEIVNYVLTTPHNTNKVILIQMLQQLINENTSGNTNVIYDGGIEGDINDSNR